MAVEDVTIEVAATGPTVVVMVRGELDIASTCSLTTQLRDAAGHGRDVVVDLSQVTFIDSTALRTLIAAHRVLEDAGHRLVLADPSAVVTRVLTLSGLVSLLHLHTRPAGPPPGP